MIFLLCEQLVGVRQAPSGYFKTDEDQYGNADE